MREIKFRAWIEDKDGGVMLDWSCIRQTAFNNQSVHEQHSATNSFSPLMYRVLTSPEYKVMQYTGLKDRNGKEIYEGDIVTYSGFLAGFLQKVDWLVWANWTRDIDKLNDPMEYIEVVGNIHENPELVD